MTEHVLEPAPQTLHGQFSSGLAPRLTVQPGDLIHVRTVDVMWVDPVGVGAKEVRARAQRAQINLRYYNDDSVGIALDETTRASDLDDLLRIFAPPRRGRAPRSAEALLDEHAPGYEGPYERSTPFLEHETFHRYQSEAELVRYLRRLERKDFSLADGMIPLGSCTMKLNPTAALEPISWPEFAAVHPFAPADQAAGYHQVFEELRAMLCAITGFDAASLQPNSGATGEYAGMLVIRAYHRSRGEDHRTVCLIPESAHGTNPASANIAGMDVVVVRCDDRGNIDLEDLRAKAKLHADALAALMLTYPSTHGVFGEHVQAITDVIHVHGGLVYWDGANMSAMAGLVRPADLGADIGHLNLHKTFAIPHGGGGPGAGPPVATEHLAPFLPGAPRGRGEGTRRVGPVAAAPHGSALIMVIAWAYLRMLGAKGLRRTSEVAVLSANYLARQLEEVYDAPVYTGKAGRVAHEFILDVRPFRSSCGVTERDVAKRLMDYGFHAPTVSWPVVGGMMIEPTESESKRELDRFVEAMGRIREEIRRVESGVVSAEDSVLRQAPHTAPELAGSEWPHPYSREDAAYPDARLRADKYWPAVQRVDEAYGDRNLVCACPPMGAYEE